MKKYILLFLLAIGWTAAAYAQQADTNGQETIEVTGTVTEKDGTPMIGVNVIAKNIPGFGVITDIDGHYKIKIPKYSYLVFSFVGFDAQEVFVKEQKTVDVVMQETDDAVIDEVVVTGTGAQKKISVYYNFERLFSIRKQIYL